MIDKVLILGSSHISRLDTYINRHPECVNLDLDDCRVHVCGISGGTMCAAHVRRYRMAIEGVRPDVIVIQLAGNDLDRLNADGLSPDEHSAKVATTLVNLAVELQGSGNVRGVVICQLMPRLNTRHTTPEVYNSMVINANRTLKAEIAQRPHLVYWNHKGIKNSVRPLLMDGVHFDWTNGYAKYLRSVRGAAIASLKV